MAISPVSSQMPGKWFMHVCFGKELKPLMTLVNPVSLAGLHPCDRDPLRDVTDFLPGSFSCEFTWSKNLTSSSRDCTSLCVACDQGPDLEIWIEGNIIGGAKLSIFTRPDACRFWEFGLVEGCQLVDASLVTRGTCCSITEVCCCLAGRTGELLRDRCWTWEWDHTKLYYYNTT